MVGAFWREGVGRLGIVNLEGIAEFVGMLRVLGCVLLLGLFGFVSMGTDVGRSLGSDGDTLRYFFVGHGYNWQWGDNRVDPRVTGLDWSRFDKKILGGDMNSEALLYKEYVEDMDSMFDLGSRNTFYVLGNHDARNENFEWYEQYTGRKSYYAYAENGAVFMVLNTTLNAGNCEELDAQYRMLKQVCDTITGASSHLFIFIHHNLWHNVPGLPSDPFQYSNWQMPYWDANCSGDTASFSALIYPMLVDVKERGVEVVNVLGDAGVLVKEKFMYSADSLIFIASGINNSKYVHDSVLYAQQPKDKILLIEHIPAERKASYHFLDLDSLFAAHQ